MVAESGPGGRHTQTGWDCLSEGPRICRTLTVPRSPVVLIVSEPDSLVTPDGSTISTQKTPMTVKPSREPSSRRKGRVVGSDIARLPGSAMAPEVALELAGDRVPA